MTKVTYYMYSYDTCCKIKEMMETDGLDSAKCQNSGKMGHYGNFLIVSEIKQKMNSSSSPFRGKKGSG